MKNKNVWFVNVGFIKFLFILLKIFFVIIKLKVILRVVCYNGNVGGMINVNKMVVMKKFLFILWLCMIVNNNF